MKHLHFDCFSGIAGDMTLGALLDLGIKESLLQEGLSSLAIKTSFELKIWREARHGIFGNRVAVLVQGQDADEIAQHTKNDARPHSHRSFQDILEIIEQSKLSAPVAARAIAIFERIANAEARLHDSEPQKVSFHEVGSIDSLIDIIGTAILLEELAPEKITASPLPMGRGFVRCQHGKLPIPAPATLEILCGVPVYDSKIQMELVTPTGAAIIATTAEEFCDFVSIVPSRIGYGIGKRNLEERPNALRVILGES